ncbi:MAG: GGDEF domain-containing protein [Hyphomonadaceae bacterium]|nr:GGDEF domain-containing protein [Hyphomonadaceae bacterium]
MLPAKRPKKPKAVPDPLEERFGLARRKLPPQVAAALETLMAENAAMAQRVAEAEALADHDPLTPCVNRRAFLRALQQSMSYAERYGVESAVLYIDLDGFKALNDAYGHAVGDACLTHIARVLCAQVRDSDVVGRLGGDEFGVILNHVSPAEAKRKAASLAEAIVNAPAVVAGVSHRVGASIGVHAFAGPEDPELAIARADESMYAEKHARKRAAAAIGG